MKKIILILIIIIINIQPVYASTTILIDSKSGQVLKSENEYKKRYPASTTKIMTMILIFEEINKGHLKYDDIVVCSKYASSMGGSQVYLEPQEKMSVEELLRCIAIASANDACVMIGEHIAGSHEEFVSMMNKKAKELKLKHTKFQNCTGLHDPNHYTCASDLAIMARHLLKVGGQKLLSITSLYDSYVREGSKKFWLVNTNKLLKQYKGVDGLKTGYTKEAKYCIVATCKKDNMRLIGVVMNEDKPSSRNELMIDLLNYGFNHYKEEVLYNKGDVISKIDITHLYKEKVNIICKEDISYLKNKTDQEITKQIIYNIQFPCHKDKPIGRLVLKRNGQEIGQFPLYCQKDIKKYNFIQKLYRVFIDLIL